MHTQIREVKKIKSINGILRANVVGTFSQAPTHSLPLDTERLRRFAPNYFSHYLKGENEDSGRRLQVVKLLTALSYCVGSSFTFLCSSISFRIAFTPKRWASAQKPAIVAVWVWVSGRGLLVGEWVVVGWVVLPLFSGSPSVMSGARHRTNLAWWRVGAGRWVLIGG